MRALILGCGYVGTAVGRELVQAGVEVHGMRRSVAATGGLSTAGIKPIVADATRWEDWQRLPSGWDWIVSTVAASAPGVEGYRAAYLETMRHLLAWCAGRPPQKLVYTSSTGVYAQDDGSWVAETAPAEPASETGQILVEAERLLLDAFRSRGFPAVVLRVAGIYGPGRGYWLKQFLAGEARLEGAGERYLNMVHRDDVAKAIVAALERGRPGEIYNVCDDEPVSQRECFRWLSETLRRPMPAPPEAEKSADRRRAATNKRISNRKLRDELAYAFKYPTFREGYTAELRRLQTAESSSGE